MSELILFPLFILVVIIATIVTHIKSKKRFNEMARLTELDIETNKAVVEALRENTAAIKESDLEFECKLTRSELINKLKEAWIADLLEVKTRIPFVEWLIREVSNG